MRKLTSGMRTDNKLWLVSLDGETDNPVGEPRSVAEAATRVTLVDQRCGQLTRRTRLSWQIASGSRCHRNWRKLWFGSVQGWSASPRPSGPMHPCAGLVTDLYRRLANSLAGSARSFGNSPTSLAIHNNCVGCQPTWPAEPVVGQEKLPNQGGLTSEQLPAELATGRVQAGLAALQGLGCS